MAQETGAPKAANRRRLARMLLGAGALTAIATPNAARADCGASICYTTYPVSTAQDIVDKLALANGGSPTGILIQPLANGTYPTIAVPGTQTLTGSFAIDAYLKAGTVNEGSDGSVDFVDGLVNNGTLFIIGATRTIASDISGSGDLELTNFSNLMALAGTLTLSGTNSYSGGTFVYGTGPSPDPLAQHYADFKTVDLLFLRPQSLPAGSAVNVGNNGTVGFGWAFDQGVLSRVHVSVPPSNIPQTVLLGGIDLGADNANPLNFTGKGALYLGATGGDWTYSGALTPGDSGHSVTAAGYSTGNPLVPMYRLGDGNGTLTVSSDLTGTAGVEIHDGYTILSGANSYSGGTHLESIGVLQFASRDALGAAGTNPIDLDAKAVVTIPGVAQDLLDHLTPDAAGTVGLMADNANDLDFTDLPNVSLGVIHASRSAAPPSVVYSGTVTPGGNTYRFGGGLGTMTLTQALHDGTTAPNGLVVNAGGALSRVILPQVETYSGDTSVGGGVLQLGNQSQRGELLNTSAISTVAGATLAFAEPNALALSRDVQGDGNLEQDGPGTLTITAGQSYTGKTAIAGGTLALASGASLANSSLVDLTHGGASLFDTSLGAASPAPVLDISAGDHTLQRLAGDASAVVKLGADTLKLVGPASLGSGIAVDAFAGTIEGSGGLQVGSGVTLQLTGANTYTGVTTIDGTQGARPQGILTVGNLGETPIATSGFVNNGLLGFEAVSNQVISTPISGSGTVYFSGPVTLVGDNSYTGRTTMGSRVLSSNGNGTYGATTLQLGDGTRSGMIGSGPIVMNPDTNPTLTFDEPVATTLSNDFLSGAGNLVQKGPGDVTLTGNGTGFLFTTVEAGSRLFVDGAFGSQFVTVNPAGALGGRGMAGFDVTVSDGGVLLGVQGQTLTMGALALSSGSIIDVSLGAPGNATGLFKVDGTPALGTTLDGTLNVSDAGGFRPGLYRIFDYTGSLTDNGLAIGTTPAGYAAGDLTVQTSVADQVNLVVAQGTGSVPTGPYVFWDGADTTANGAVDGGSATWNATATNWTNTAADANGTYDPAALLIFTGTAGTVTVDAGGAGSLPLGAGLQFANDGFKVQGNDLALTAASTTVRVGGGTQAGAGYTATIAANLTGAGGLDKTDLGTLILTGTNTYTGGTTVAGGALQIGNGGTTGSIAGNVTDDGALVFDRSDAVTFGGVISGNGTLRKLGTGALTLSGDSTYTGGTTVAAGLLQVDGTLASMVTVGNAASLGGTGRIGGLTVASGGTVAPGHSIGTLTVAGDYVQAAGSTYAVEIDDAGHSDKIAATGAATLRGGTVLVKPGAGAYQDGARYSIVTAASRSGQFAGVQVDPALRANLGGLDPELMYLPSGVDLLLSGNGTPVGTMDARSADGFATLQTSLLYGQEQFVDTVARAMTPLGMRFDALAATGAPIRLAQASAMNDAGGPPPGFGPGAQGGYGWRGWLSGYGKFGHFDASNGARSADSDLGGSAFGLDTPIGRHGLLGVVGGYAHHDLSTSGGAFDGDIDVYSVGAYGRYGFGPAHLAGIVNWARQQGNTDRNTATGRAHAHYDGHTWSAYGEAGSALALGRSFLEPVASLHWLKLERDGFAEHRAGASNLTLRGDDDTLLRSRIGARLFRRFETERGFLTPEIRAYWAHDFDRAGSSVDAEFSAAPAADFRAAGVRPGRDAAIVGIGLNMGFTQRVTGFVDYDADVRRDYAAHAVSVGVRVSL